ncbi:MAG: CPBP family intramembrane metalloprotease [Bacteroidota bacterium]|nr:CPBP family intramembrane metalloprotease [Bacteroidota bacterium]
MAFNLTFRKILNFPLTKIIAGALVCVGTALLMNSIGRNLTKGLHIDEDYKKIITGALVAVSVLISYTLLFKYYERREISELKFNHFTKYAVTGFSIGTLLQSLVILVIYIGGGFEIVRINPVSYVVPGFGIALTSAVFEEILLRGILFRLLEEKLGSIIALAVSALVFGLLHLANPNSSVYSAIAISLQAGVLLGASYMYARSLWLPIFLHFAWNFAEAGIFGAIISGGSIDKSLFTTKFSGPVLLTGGAFGPENSIQATLFCVVAASIFLYLSRKENKFIKPFWYKKDQ